METSLSEALGETPEETTVVETKAESVEAPAPVEEIQDTPGEQEAAPEPEAKTEPPMVPLAALHEVRDSNRELRQRLDQIQAANQPKPEPVPDILDEPEKYAQYIQRTQSAQMVDMRLNMSEEMTRMTLGDEVVDAAFEAFKPNLGTPVHDQIMTARNPYKAMVDWHKQQQVISEIGDDPAAYRARLEAEIRAEVEAQAAVKQVKEGVKPPPSLATQSNLGVRAGPAWSGPASLKELIGE